MERIAQHKLLVAGESFENCCYQVNKFFDLTSLVIYDCIEVINDLCLPASDQLFSQQLHEAEQKNRDSVELLMRELQQTGVKTIEDLQYLEHGYPSKMLHIISHFLDGFIGIDSHFYSLVEDSHWLSDPIKQQLKDEPKKFWLIHIDCYSATPEEAGLLRM